MSRKLLAEFIGSFFLLAAVSCTGNPAAIGAMLAVMIYMAGHLSGGHFNPAVSFAFFLGKKLKTPELIGYWLAQVAGMFAAAAFCQIVKGELFIPAAAPGISTLAIVLTEVVCTFALTIVILTVATAKKLAGNHIYGIAIGSTLFAIATLGGGISGGVFNPAVAIGPMLYSLISGAGNFENLLCYLVAPCIGAAIARVVFDLLENE